MTETQDSIDLVGLFEAAAQAVAAQKMESTRLMATMATMATTWFRMCV